MSLKNTNQLKKHYELLFSKFKDSFKTAQQSSKQTQEKRMSILVDGIKFNKNTRILDFGCGTAHLYDYLVNRFSFNGYYTGIDIAENIIQFNKKKYQSNKKVSFICGDITKSKSFNLKKHDYVLVSGTFNNKIKNNWMFMKKAMLILFKITNKKLIFNNLSSYVDFYDKKLFYICPEKVFKFCKLNLSKFVSIRHDYQIKKNVIPFEFTTYVIKSN